MNRSPRRRAADWVHHELAAGCLATEGFEVRNIDREATVHLMEESDVIWVHGLQTANMFGIYHWPRSILDIDDIPSRFFFSRARNASVVTRKIHDYRKALLWWRRERILGRRFSVVAVASEEDRRYLGRGARITVVPNGFNPPTEQHPKITTEPPRIGLLERFAGFPTEAALSGSFAMYGPR